MTFVRSNYPTDWPEIREQIRERSGNRCEAICKDCTRCEARNHVFYHRSKENPEQLFECAGTDIGAGHLNDCLERDVYEVFPVETRLRPVRIVLTTAHLPGVPAREGDLQYLEFRCQWHHLFLDRPHHLAVQRENRNRRRQESIAASGQLSLLENAT